MQKQTRNAFRQRSADLDGEILIVRDYFGAKVLADPVDDNVVVEVRPGRRARLIDFNIDNHATTRGHHALTVVFFRNRSTGFASVRHVGCSVMLQDLPNGQLVDVFPDIEASSCYAAVFRPLPVLCGAISAEPVYAAVAA